MNLTQTSKFFKTALKVLLVFVVVYYLFILYLGPQTKSIIKKLFPRKEPINPIYGVLPPLEFVEKPLSGLTPKYVLNTKNGQLPDKLPARMLVYRTKTPQFSYLDGTDAIKDAATLGFFESDQTSNLKENEYTWKSLSSDGTLSIKLQTKEISLHTDITRKADRITSGTLTEEIAKQKTFDIFTALGRIDDTYTKGEQKIYLGKISTNKIIPALNQRDTQVARVDLFRKLDKYKVMPTDPTKGLLHVYVTDPVQKVSSPLTYPVIESYYWNILPNAGAYYPIIDVEDAWESVKSGKGVIASVVPKNMNPFTEYSATSVESILVDNVYLAYYETPKRQNYIQPIYVFEGLYTTRGSDGGDITLYFPAITADYVSRTLPTNNP